MRLWKIALQRFANESGLRLSVCHFPSATSKWNQIEHRLFSHLGMNGRGKPLNSHEVIVNLIGSTTTRSELTVTAELDTNLCEKGLRIGDGKWAAVNLEKAAFHGEWNDSIEQDGSW